MNTVTTTTNDNNNKKKGGTTEVERLTLEVRRRDEEITRLKKKLRRYSNLQTKYDLVVKERDSLRTMLQTYWEQPDRKSVV